MWSSFLKSEITFTLFRFVGKIPDENDKLAKRSIGSPKVLRNSFKNLIGVLEGPVDLLFRFYNGGYFLFIRWSNEGRIFKGRNFEKWQFGLISFFSMLLAIEGI